MAEISEIKNYLTKLKKVINYEVDFKFVDIGFIKKNKIDDVLCCLIATLPDVFKKSMRNIREDKYASVNLFRTLCKKMENRFFLNSKFCVINPDECNRIIGMISTTIEKDIRLMENL